MRIAAMATSIILANGLAHAELHGDISLQPPHREVIVCLQNPSAIAGAATATILASRMFAKIGVTVDWRRGGDNCPPQSIIIDMTGKTPDSLKPGSLAVAFPYEGSQILVFQDRILRTTDRPYIPFVLAHVFVHEITHILQGVPRHSVTGVMKSHWASNDFCVMSWKPLEFEPGDILLIYQGLERRGSHPAPLSPETVVAPQ